MKKQITAFIFTVFCMVISIVLSSCGATSIVDLNDYVEITTSGYDGYGYASYVVNYDKLYADNVSAFGINKKSTEADIDTAKRLIHACVDGVLDKTEKLANGETITFAWAETNLSTLEAKYEIKIKHSNYTQKVANLSKLEDFDPFEGLKVTFEGFSGQGAVNINSYGVIDNTLRYDVNTGRNLRNGETITVEVSAPRNGDLKDYEGIKGKNPTVATKDYIVSGLNTYIQSIEEIDPVSYAEIDQQIQDTFQAHVAKSWIEANTLKDIQFIGNYVLISKDLSIRMNPNNIVYFLYQYEATTPDLAEDFTGFYYGKLTNVYLDAENNLIYSLSDIEYPTGNFRFGASGTIFIVGDYYYLGYHTYEDFVTKEITANVDNYNYTDNVSIN